LHNSAVYVKNSRVSGQCVYAIYASFSIRTIYKMVMLLLWLLLCSCFLISEKRLLSYSMYYVYHGHLLYREK